MYESQATEHLLPLTLLQLIALGRFLLIFPLFRLLWALLIKPGREPLRQLLPFYQTMPIMIKDRRMF